MVTACGKPIFAPQPAEVQRLSAAAATSVANGVALTEGDDVEFRAATDCRIRFGTVAPTAVATDILMISGAVFRWTVESDTLFIAIINADFAVEGHVYPISP